MNLLLHGACLQHGTELRQGGACVPLRTCVLLFGFWELPYAVTTAVPKRTELRRTALGCSKTSINIDGNRVIRFQKWWEERAIEGPRYTEPLGQVTELSPTYRFVRSQPPAANRQPPLPYKVRLNRPPALEIACTQFPLRVLEDRRDIVNALRSSRHARGPRSAHAVPRGRHGRTRITIPRLVTARKTRELNLHGRWTDVG